MNLHLCQETKGQTPDCQTCSVSRTGHLNDFIKILARQTKELQTKPLLNDYEREDEKNKKFCQLLFDHFEWLQLGQGQEEMAERCGLTHDNFWQKLSRARKHVKKAIPIGKMKNTIELQNGYTLLDGGIFSNVESIP